MSWTEERIERLKSMWTEGATASQIAEDLGGVSRNAVIGKAHRLGLESRPSPVKPGEEKEKKAKAAPAPKTAKPAPAPKAATPTPQPRETAAEAPRRPVTTGGAPTPKTADASTIQYRSVGPGGFIRQGPGDTQASLTFTSAESRRTRAIPIASTIAASPTRRSCHAATGALRLLCPSAGRAYANRLSPGLPAGAFFHRVVAPVPLGRRLGSLL